VDPYSRQTVKLISSRLKAEESIKDIDRRLKELEQNPPKRTGLASGKYPELRAIRKSQVALQGGKRMELVPDLGRSAGAAYYGDTREMVGSRSFIEGPRGVEGIRHEKWHDVQNVGKRLNRYISTPLEKVTWGGFEKGGSLSQSTRGMTLLDIANAQKATEAASSGWRGGLGQFAMEGQAYIVGKKSVPAGIAQFIQSSPAYVDNPRYAAGRPLFKTLATVKSATDAGRDLIPAARSLGRALGTEAASVGGMALRGAGRLVGPVGLAMTAYDLAQAFPAPAPISEEDMSRAMREYRTGPQPQFAR
jgi:hypothetical protein